LYPAPGHVINAAVSEAAIVVDALEKFFPPARSGWRTFLQPFEKPSVAALAGVSFEVGEGEAVGLLGANGAGKSTLLRILATLLYPTRGSARVAGHDTVRDPRAVRRQLGYHAGSDLGFFPRLTGRENLLFFGQLNQLPLITASNRVAQISSQLRLEDVLNRQVRTLSSGTVQRLSLARALLHLPHVLLLDEPTRSLDALAAAEFRNLLKLQVLKRGTTSLLFASHSLPELKVLANRIAVLEQGRLLALDSPSALVRQTSAASLEEAFFKITGHAPGALKDPQE
jgi:ABC-type multidrug transport system ATPase subunit